MISRNKNYPAKKENTHAQMDLELNHHKKAKLPSGSLGRGETNERTWASENPEGLGVNLELRLHVGQGIWLRKEVCE